MTTRNDPMTSKDDTSTPSFQPVKCPICFEVVWENDQVITCSSCGQHICVLCTDGMKQSSNLVRTGSKDRRRFVMCPLCMNSKIYLTEDVETGHPAADRQSLLPRRQRRPPPPDPRTQEVICNVKRVTRLCLCGALAAIALFMANQQ